MKVDLKRIAKFYGPIAQLNQLKSECAELIDVIDECLAYNNKISEIHKSRDVSELPVRVLEEMADVKVVIDGLMAPGGIAVVEDLMRHKINRQLRRIDRAKILSPKADKGNTSTPNRRG